jgi:hypothetical protein
MSSFIGDNNFTFLVKLIVILKVLRIITLALMIMIVLPTSVPKEAPLRPTLHHLLD